MYAFVNSHELTTTARELAAHVRTARRVRFVLGESALHVRAYVTNAVQLSDATKRILSAVQGRAHNTVCAHSWTRNIYCPMCLRPTPHATSVPLCPCTCASSVRACVHEMTQHHEHAWNTAVKAVRAFVNREHDRAVSDEHRLRQLPVEVVQTVR